MKILALEFSSERRSVAVVADDRPAAPCGTGPSQVPAKVLSFASDTGARSVKALAMVESALREAHLAREEVQTIAVGLGPGSYTGIRVAIALAQGWQLARGVRLMGLGSADAIAAQAQACGRRGTIHVAIDAQRNESYLGGYELNADGWKETSPLKLVPVQELQSLAATGAVLIGPEIDRWVADATVMFPDARQLGLLASALASIVPGEKLEPIYLRQVSFVKAPPARLIPDFLDL